MYSGNFNNSVVNVVAQFMNPDAGGQDSHVKKRLTINKGQNAEPAFLDIMKKYYPEGGWSLLHQKIAALRVARLDSVYSDPYSITECYLVAGDIDNAMYWIEKAYEEHDPNLPYLLLPHYDILRDDSRFHEIARKMNLPYK